MIEKLKELLDREPFVPFRIVLTSGVGYDVISPYQVAIGETQLDYYYSGTDRTAVLRMSRIASYEIGEPARQ